MHVNVGSVIGAAMVGSVTILLLMYFLMPALGLPRLNFADITGGWVGAKGKYSQAMGVLVFLAGGVAWTYLYARLSPHHNALAGMAFSLIPFAFSMLTVLPELARFRIMAMPGFVWVKVGGPQAVAANLIEHLVFGLVIGLLVGP